MKRLVFCFDGTWNDIEMGNPTNVAKIAQAISLSDCGIAQILHYDEGVGTDDLESAISKGQNALAGMFGHGLRDNIMEAYTFLVLNYEPGDEIYVFGFSRGAFTARSFCGLLRNVGVVDRRHLNNLGEAIDRYVSRHADDSPDTDYCRQFRFDRQDKACLQRDIPWLSKRYPDLEIGSLPLISVSYLGVWDTVGALGLPVPDILEDRINQEYGFHDTKLSTFVESARHAVAADEKRATFTPTLWENIDELRRQFPERYDEKIFPGTHGSVGGGGPVIGLSDAALEWVLRGAKNAGLKFDVDEGSPLYRLQPNHKASLHNVTGKEGWSWKDWVTGVGLKVREFPNLTADDLHDSVIFRYHDETMTGSPEGLYRPEALKKIFADIEARKPEFKGDLSKEVFENKIAADRSLMPPCRIETYVIQPQDDIGRIARKFFDGNSEMADVIYLHNFQIGLLHNKSKMYVGRTIEIPYFD